MIYPSIDRLLEIADSKYSLVVGASRRARVLKEGAALLIQKPKSFKYVGMALEEIEAGELIIQNK